MVPVWQIRKYLPEEVAFSCYFKLEKHFVNQERSGVLCSGNSILRGLGHERAWHFLRLGEGFPLTMVSGLGSGKK